MTSHCSASYTLLGLGPMLTSVLSVSKELLVHNKVAHCVHWAVVCRTLTKVQALS